MAILLDKSLWFPDPELSHADGLLAIGGDLNPKRLLLAYQKGIFPWFNEDQPPLWWSPDPRMVIFPEDIYISKSMRKVLRLNTFTVTFNQSFLEVILACKRIPRDGQDDTWITNDLVASFLKLHQQGYANSVEVWQNNNLVGGLYGVDLKEKGIFCGESMFSLVSNASKVGLIMLSRKLKQQNYKLIDCQIHTDHLERMGGFEMDRANFLSYLK